MDKGTMTEIDCLGELGKEHPKSERSRLRANIPKGDQMSNKDLVEELIQNYQQLNPKTETTIDAGIVLEDAEGLPLIVSLKDTQPPCDVDALTSLLDNKISEGWQAVGKVFGEASAEISIAWVVPYPGHDNSSLYAARDAFQQQ